MENEPIIGQPVPDMEHVSNPVKMRFTHTVFSHATEYVWDTWNLTFRGHISTPSIVATVNRIDLEAMLLLDFEAPMQFKTGSGNTIQRIIVDELDDKIDDRRWNRL